jgi:hypothetical protein
VEWIPVAPNSAFEMAPVKGVREVTPPVVIDPKAIEDTRVSSQEISVTLAGNLNIGAIFTGAVSANEVGYWLDAMAYSDRYEETPAASGLVLASRFGFGLRVMFRVRKLNPKATLNYGLIGAAIDAGFAQASYEIDAIGFGPKVGQALSMILEGIAESGPSLTSDVFYKLNSSILKNLAACINDNLATMQPARVATLVHSALVTDSLDTSHAVLFAMRQIRKGRTLQDALEAADMDPATIRLTYEHVMGYITDTTKPSSADRDKADVWLGDN